MPTNPLYYGDNLEGIILGCGRPWPLPVCPQTISEVFGV